MRQIVLDTETTGLEFSRGHRIIEIGALEMIDRKKTGLTFHEYLNPEREIEDGAFDVHGISNDFLMDKPRFSDIATAFINFVRDSELIIHNAPFDTGFINSELAMLGREWGCIEDYSLIIDTLKIAREKHPGQKNNLDALCARYSVDNSRRNVHGALLDAQILADVYLAMTGGQTALSLDENPGMEPDIINKSIIPAARRDAIRVIYPDRTETDLHRQRLEAIDRESSGRCIWLKIQPQEQEN
jgi:DNA polymerase-3 subunit epsilon